MFRIAYHLFTVAARSGGIWGTCVPRSGVGSHRSSTTSVSVCAPRGLLRLDRFTALRLNPEGVGEPDPAGLVGRKARTSCRAFCDQPDPNPRLLPQTHEALRCSTLKS